VAEGLTTPDGTAVKLDRDFAAAMAAPESDEPVAPAPPKVDKEAPFGRKADGSPRQRPAGPGRGRRTTTQPAKQPAAAVSETAQEASQRRAEGVQGLMQLGAGLCLALSARGGDAFKADAYTLAANSEPFGSACASVAAENPGFAAALDKITQAGPYAALMTIAVPMVTQIVRNHRPAMKLPGTSNPADLVTALEAATPSESVEADAGNHADAA